MRNDEPQNWYHNTTLKLSLNSVLQRAKFGKKWTSKPKEDQNPFWTFGGHHVSLWSVKKISPEISPEISQWSFFRDQWLIFLAIMCFQKDQSKRSVPRSVTDLFSEISDWSFWKHMIAKNISQKDQSSFLILLE